MQDHKEQHYGPARIISEAVRFLAVVVYNAAFGREKKDMIKDPQKLWKFPWEKESRPQSVPEMKSVLLALSAMKGTKLTTKSKEKK